MGSVYSDEVLQGIREGKVEGVMAYSMYSFGIYAVKSAVYSIEGKKVDHLTKTKVRVDHAGQYKRKV